MRLVGRFFCALRQMKKGGEAPVMGTRVGGWSSLDVWRVWEVRVPSWGPLWISVGLALGGWVLLLSLRRPEGLDPTAPFADMSPPCWAYDWTQHCVFLIFAALWFEMV